MSKEITNISIDVLKVHPRNTEFFDDISGKEYEEFNKEHDFPEPQILVDFDQLAKFINLSIRTEFIPEVSFYKSGRNYVNDGKKFEKILFDNLQKSEVLLVEMEEEKYVFKRIK